LALSITCRKPFEIEEMEVKIEKGLEVERLKNELEYLRGTQQDIYDFDRIVESSSALQKVLDIVKKVAKRATPRLLIRARNGGTGKETIAGAITIIRCGTSRQFRQGQLRRAFRRIMLGVRTFRSRGKARFTGADKQRIGPLRAVRTAARCSWTKIGDMSPSHPGPKFLRVLQEHEFERSAGHGPSASDPVRLVAATNRDLPTMVQAGQFREDLLLPAQRRRPDRIEMAAAAWSGKDDIVPLANSFILRFSADLKKRMDGLEPEAQKKLLIARTTGRANIPRASRTRFERGRCCSPRGRAITGDDLRLGDTPERGLGTRITRRFVRKIQRKPGVPARGRGASRSDPKALKIVELGSEGMRRKLLSIQPAGDELQDQDARHRISEGRRRARASGGRSRRSPRAS